MKILIADDMPQIRRLLRNLLEDHGGGGVSAPRLKTVPKRLFLRNS